MDLQSFLHEEAKNFVKPVRKQYRDPNLHAFLMHYFIFPFFHNNL